jgi:5-methylcytosine-specific restriction endonuclease McrA
MVDDKHAEYYDPTEYSEGINIIPGMNKSKKKKLINNTKGFWSTHEVLNNGIDYYACHYCNHLFTRRYITKDHIVPKSKGGLNRVSNYVPSCSRCNSEKGSMSYEDYMKSKGKQI